MDKEQVARGVEKVRAGLRTFDAARRRVMMAFWVRIADSPQKAGYTALTIAIVFFLLGRWSK